MKRRFSSLVVLLVVALTGTRSDAIAQAAAAAASAARADVAIHDPTIIRSGNAYYLFGTGDGIAVFSSTDMKQWRALRPVFAQAPAWAAEMLPGFRNQISAPAIHERNGTFYLYYAVSSFGQNNSAIGVATNVTLDPNQARFAWKDHGIVVQSVPGKDMWNAIDPYLVNDTAGVPWLAFGSHWGGIKLVKLDSSLTRQAEPQEWHTIAARERYWKLDDRDAGNAANPELNYEKLYPARIVELSRASHNGAIEAPVIVRKNGYYYLLASWDRCCNGATSTYKVVVGRARELRGPYLDREGQNLLYGGGSLVVHGFGGERWAAGGHNDVISVDGTDHLVFHAYDKTDNGQPKLVIRPIVWDRFGWPTVTIE